MLYFAIAFVAALVVRFVWSRISRQPSKPSTGRLQKYPVTVLLFVQYLPLVILPAYLFATLRTMRRTTWIRTQQTPVRRIAGPRVSI